MKHIRRAYSRTVSLIDETAVQIYENYIGRQKGFLLESYDKNNGRYVFMGKNPEEIIHTEGDCLVIRRADGEMLRLDGNPVDRLKDYCKDLEIYGFLEGYKGMIYGNYKLLTSDDFEFTLRISSVSMPIAPSCRIADPASCYLHSLCDRGGIVVCISCGSKSKRNRSWRNCCHFETCGTGR